MNQQHFKEGFFKQAYKTKLCNGQLTKIWHWGSQEPNTTISTGTNGSVTTPNTPDLPLAKAFVPCIAGLWAKLVVDQGMGAAGGEACRRVR